MWSATARSAVYRANEAGCGSQLGAEPSGLNPYGAFAPAHGSGTRQPSRTPLRLPVRWKIGSVITSSGRSSTSGRPSSSPWYR
uniref:hypothetical protein n=1 Tax=Kitasatospora fiedleri TaxID=2991545 RepID=UPI00384E473F